MRLPVKFKFNLRINYFVICSIQILFEIDHFVSCLIQILFEIDWFVNCQIQILFEDYYYYYCELLTSNMLLKRSGQTHLVNLNNWLKNSTIIQFNNNWVRVKRFLDFTRTLLQLNFSSLLWTRWWVFEAETGITISKKVQVFF